MSFTAATPDSRSLYGTRQRHVSVARERGVGYDPGGEGAASQGDSDPGVSPGQVADPAVSPAAAAIAALDAAVAGLAGVDWSRESADSVRRASVVLQRSVNRVTAQALRPIQQLDARSAYRFDGAVTAASWLRNRTNMDPGTAARLCTAARRLRGSVLTGLAWDLAE